MDQIGKEKLRRCVSNHLSFQVEMLQIVDYRFTTMMEEMAVMTMASTAVF